MVSAFNIWWYQNRPFCRFSVFSFPYWCCISAGGLSMCLLPVTSSCGKAFRKSHKGLEQLHWGLEKAGVGGMCKGSAEGLDKTCNLNLVVMPLHVHYYWKEWGGCGRRIGSDLLLRDHLIQVHPEFLQATMALVTSSEGMKILSC